MRKMPVVVALSLLAVAVVAPCAAELTPNKTHAVLNVTYTNYDDVPQAKKKLVFVGQKKPKNKIVVTTDMYGETAFLIPREDAYTILCESLTGPFECGETPYVSSTASTGGITVLFDDTRAELTGVNFKVGSFNDMVPYGSPYKVKKLSWIRYSAAGEFEEAYKNDTSKEYDIELAPKPKEGEKVNPNEGKKVYKQLLDYLNHDVSFTAKNAVNLLILVRNMEENKAYVNSNSFENVIVLRSASVLSLWRFIMEGFNGKGFFEARTFLECWAKCGESVSNAVRQIQKDNADTRQLGTDLNNIEEEFNRSEDDLPHNEEEVTTKEEVDPEVSE